VNIRFEAWLSDSARWLLARLYDTDRDAYAQLTSCIARLERDPFPESEHITTLVIPRRGVYHNALRCDGWAIAFHVEDDTFVVIDEIGRTWPPIDPSLRRQP